MRKLDIGGSIFWAAVAVYVCIRSVKLGLGNYENPGPGFIFFWCGVALGGLSLVILASAVTAKRNGTATVPGKVFTNVNCFKILFTLASLILYAIFLEKLGFLISTFLLISFLLNSIGAKKIYLVILISFASTILTYAIFGILLHTRLPRGILGL